uniref:Tetraspanin n=1 Tax=Macrostomum lignano TaxID=282301 RepID=A0A1I8HF60_9PLAT
MCQCMNKFILVAVNIIFLLAGLVITGIAIWVIVSKDTMFDLVQLVTKDVDVDRATLDNYMNSTSMLLAAAYIVLVFGCISIVVGFCGCCARAQGELLSAHYAIAISIVLIAEIVGAILAAVFRNQIGDKLQPRLVTLEREHFLPLGLTLNNKTTDAVITAWVNYAQTSFECCGVTNQTDITGPDTLWTRSHREFNGKLQTMPVTCCRMKATRSELLGKQDWNNVADYLEDPACPNTGNGVVTEIICVVMACSLIQKIRSEAGTTA